jgi:hypothetical protein
LICRRCQRDNDARRAHCGGCGGSLAPVCAGCSFVNGADDRFCGGCGTRLPDAVAAHAAAPPAPPPELAATRRTGNGVPMVSQAELLELLAAPAPASDTGLPDGIVGQDDLDRLFGEPA